MTSVRVDILARYCKFVRVLQTSLSMKVAVISAVARQDVRTITWSNVALIRRETGMEPVLSSLVQLKCELKTRRFQCAKHGQMEGEVTGQGG